MAKSKSKIGFISKFFLALNIIFAILLLISGFSKYANPAQYSLLPFFGLLFIFFVIANVIFIPFWLIKNIKFCSLSLIVLIVNYNNILSYCQIRKEQKIPEHSIKIMSYNVKLFGLYNSYSDDSSNKSEHDSIMELINKENPNIIFLQEYYYDKKEKFTTKSDLLKVKNLKYFSHSFLFTRDKHQFGTAVFSSYPIIKSNMINFGQTTGNSCMYCDVVVNNDTIRMFNVHLASIHFGKEDYNFIHELSSNNNDTLSIKQSSLKIFRKLRKAYMIRATQVEKLAQEIAISPYKVVIAGDFNDPPVSYTYNSIAKLELLDAYKESGNGWSNTFAGILPLFRIDYIFHSSKIKSFRYKTIKKKFSDHYPITCYVKI